jgi:hypothetical protein
MGIAFFLTAKEFRADTLESIGAFISTTGK